MRFVISFVLLMSATIVQAQTVSPFTQECSKKCDGSFTLTNNQMQASNFTIDVYRTTFTSAGPQQSAVDGDTIVKFTPQSGRMGPKEEVRVDFSVKCKVVPCQVTFKSTMTAGGREGISMRLILPFTVYACDKTKNCRSHTLEEVGLLAKQ